MNVHDFAPAFSVGHTNFDFTVKATRSTESRVERITAIGGSNHHDVVPSLHTVHQREHLSNDAAFHFARDVFTLGANGIYFVNEDDSRCVVRSLIEDFSQLLLGFTVVL